MKFVLAALCALLGGCAMPAKNENPTAAAQVGIVNHTGRYIYSASVDGRGGENMSAWGAGMANICCTSIPNVWYPGLKVAVRWDMPEGHIHVVKEKIVEVEKYDRTGSVYLHFFPDDEVRVVVTSILPWHPDHPIPQPVDPAAVSKIN